MNGKELLTSAIHFYKLNEVGKDLSCHRSSVVHCLHCVAPEYESQVLSVQVQVSLPLQQYLVMAQMQQLVEAMESVPPKGRLAVHVQVEETLLTGLQAPHKIGNEHVPHLGKVHEDINLLKQRKHCYHAQDCVGIQHLLQYSLPIPQRTFIRGQQ
jgi:hypothetical protein